MLYISKGIPHPGSDRNHIVVSWRGKEYPLAGVEARLWRQGRFDTALADSKPLAHLHDLGLVDTVEGDQPLLMFRLLTQCAICPVKPCLSFWPLHRTEHRLLRWIRRAGLRLTFAELVYLVEQDFRPVPELLGVENRQALTEAIYNTETIADGLLEARMENAFARNETVEAVLGLLRKRRIFLI